MILEKDLRILDIFTRPDENESNIGLQQKWRNNISTFDTKARARALWLGAPPKDSPLTAPPVFESEEFRLCTRCWSAILPFRHPPPLPFRCHPQSSLERLQTYRRIPE